jgi:hypothetical protein
MKSLIKRFLKMKRRAKTNSIFNPLKDPNRKTSLLT